jgi:formylmethanofuran dehydrogenase subunit E
VERARVAALKEPRFFRRCVRCGELNNAGHMHDREICQSCAERFFGVVY